MCVCVCVCVCGFFILSLFFPRSSEACVARECRMQFAADLSTSGQPLALSRSATMNDDLRAFGGVAVAFGECRRKASWVGHSVKTGVRSSEEAWLGQ